MVLAGGRCSRNLSPPVFTGWHLLPPSPSVISFASLLFEPWRSLGPCFVKGCCCVLSCRLCGGMSCLSWWHQGWWQMETGRGPIVKGIWDHYKEWQSRPSKRKREECSVGNCMVAAYGSVTDSHTYSGFVILKFWRARVWNGLQFSVKTINEKSGREGERSRPLFARSFETVPRSLR